MLCKTQPMFWDMNESTGLRHVTIENDGRVLFVVTANREGTTWTSSLIPMGFKMYLDEVYSYTPVLTKFTDLMEKLEKPDLTLEEIQEFLLTMNG